MQREDSGREGAGHGHIRGGFDGVGVAQVQQGPVGHAANVGAVDRGEGGEGLVPGGADIRGGSGGFGSDRVGGVIVAG
jgi:hypothetical protein